MENTARVWWLFVSIILLLGGFQNCGFGHHALEDSAGAFSSNLSENTGSSYWGSSPKNPDLQCEADGSFVLSAADKQLLAQSEAASSNDRHLVVHLQPLEFATSENSWSNIYSKNFGELKSALKSSEGNFKVAAGISIFAFEANSACQIEQQLNDAFAQAEQYDLPIVIHVDFEWMIDWRSDIWNWHSPSAAGYQEQNKDKVEWSNWNEPIQKFGIFWDAHGIERKARVCYSNPQIQAEVVQKGRFIAAVINKWRLRLANLNRSYLFVSVDPGWETGIQDYRGVEVAKKMGVDYQLGYCALHHEGYSAANPPSNPKQVLANVVRKYAELEARVFYEAGIPRQKIFTHIVGTDGDQTTAPHPGRLFFQNSPLEVAFNNYSIPGFSLYPNAYYPELIKKHTSGRPWVIAETAFQGFSHLHTFAGDRNLRSINVYSWDMIRNNSNSVSELKTILNYPLDVVSEPPATSGTQQPAPTSPPTTTAQGPLTGAVEALQGFTISGWSCLPGSTSAVTYEVYAGNFGGAVALLGTGLTNQTRSEFKSQCGSFQTVGWSFTFNDMMMKLHEAKDIHVKAKVNQQEVWLYKPAAYKVPQSSMTTRLNGSVDKMAGDIISGWACSPDFATPVRIEVYAGDFKGPKIVASTSTAIQRDDLAHVCGTYKPVGWSYQLTYQNKVDFQNQDLHIKAKLFEAEMWLYKPAAYVVPQP